MLSLANVWLLFVLPGVMAIAAPGFAAFATVASNALSRPLRAMDWLRAEIVVGALWGVLSRSFKYAGRGLSN